MALKITTVCAMGRSEICRGRWVKSGGGVGEGGVTVGEKKIKDGTELVEV